MIPKFKPGDKVYWADSSVVYVVGRPMDEVTVLALGWKQDHIRYYVHEFGIQRVKLTSGEIIEEQVMRGHPNIADERQLKLVPAL